MRVADVMTPRSELVTATVPGSREDVLRILQRGEFSSVPVVKETADGEVFRGLVSRERLIEEPNEEQLALLIEDVPPIEADASIEELAERIATSGDRRVPVGDGGLDGIVTITDVVRAIANGELDGETPVGDVAGDDVHTVYHGSPLVPTQRGLYYADEAYAVVLDDDGDMTGIVTEVDIIDVAEVVEGEEGTGDSIAGQDSDWAWEGIKAIGNRMLPTRNVELPDGPIADVMTADVVTVPPTVAITKTAQEMIRNDVEQIPVVSGDRLVGIVKDIHLMEPLYG